MGVILRKKSLTLRKIRKGLGDYPGNAAIPRPQGLNPLLGSAFCLFINGDQAVPDPLNYTTTRHTGLSAHREGFIAYVISYNGVACEVYRVSS